MLSFILLMAGMGLREAGVAAFSNNIVCLAWFILAFLPVGLGVMREAWECAMNKEVFSEFMLMTIASIGAFIIGEYPEAVAVMLFYCVGETLQDMAVDKARDNIRSLMEFHPKMAVIIRGNHKVADKPENVIPGEIIEVKPGERVPLDGILTSGDAAFNTSALTGESMPRTIASGKEVLAGMIATDSVARIRVTRPESESAVARILKMVEDASERKAPAELFIRKFARIYTPVVILLAALTVIVPYVWSVADTDFVYNFSTWFYRALIFLVISCPCALVISIPLSYFAGIGAASKNGILFKGGNWLDAVTHLDTVVFDKTGTLTRGVFSVTKVCGDNTDTLIATVAAMERNSNHPIAKAITAFAGDRKAQVSDVKDLPGYGMRRQMARRNAKTARTRERKLSR